VGSSLEGMRPGASVLARARGAAHGARASPAGWQPTGGSGCGGGHWGSKRAGGGGHQPPADPGGSPGAKRTSKPALLNADATERPRFRSADLQVGMRAASGSAPAELELGATIARVDGGVWRGRSCLPCWRPPASSSATRRQAGASRGAHHSRSQPPRWHGRFQMPFRRRNRCDARQDRSLSEQAENRPVRRPSSGRCDEPRPALLPEGLPHLLKGPPSGPLRPGQRQTNSHQSILRSQVRDTVHVHSDLPEISWEPDARSQCKLGEHPVPLRPRRLRGVVKVEALDDRSALPASIRRGLRPIPERAAMRDVAPPHA